MASRLDSSIGGSQIQKKKEQIEEAKKELKEAKKAHKDAPSDKSKKLLEKEKAFQRLSEQLKKLQLQETDREENKVIALGTSKLNYLDARITVAWCTKKRKTD
ncbi:DNA topoisomerase 1-like [Sinocyclocheilus grahami]|uniref:DNA topoisomerase 1-like n=1 Tax=Sinocyclocheilus grahami TaxID=75366 RepID=UPI0007AD4BB8|nr:PREDICTED: DNA topoisomerase 1-like [Sinocyclocheilus grahami]